MIFKALRKFNDKIFEALALVNINRNRQGINKKTEHVFEFDAFAISNRRSHGKMLLPGILVQQQGINRKVNTEAGNFMLF